MSTLSLFLLVALFAGSPAQADSDRTTCARIRLSAVDELYQFARDQLRLGYIFGGTQEPHYSTQILPFLNSLAHGEGR